MKFVIYGAGAVGGVIGARLFQADHDVVLIARGEHGRILRDRGLELVTPDGADQVKPPSVERPDAIDWHADDVVILAVKSQDTGPVLDALSACAPPSVRVVCAQNGVENERMALRRFAHVYGVNVNLPATFLEPGRVVAHSAPINGLLDIGCFPDGIDATAEELAEAFRGAGYSSEARADMSRWKYRKLVLNLGNAALALCGPGDEDVGRLHKLLRTEGEGCFAAAGIDVATSQEDKDRRGDLLTLKPVAGIERVGGSSWQSLARGLGSIETDYLNGEVVLLGRLHGVPTPANGLVQRLANEAARERRPPGHLTAAEVLDMLTADQDLV